MTTEQQSLTKTSFELGINKVVAHSVTRDAFSTAF